jgi:hypothetical protein
MFSESLAASARPLAVIALFALGACQSPERPVALEDQDPEEVEEFHRSLGEYANTVDDLLKETRQGQNVSSFSLGMLSYGILTTVSASDRHLYDYFCANGQGVDAYLKTRFQDHPQLELAALDQMRNEGNSALRTSARYTLEALTHIPQSNEPPDVQQRKREALAVALKHTETSLNEAAGGTAVHN